MFSAAEVADIRAEEAAGMEYTYTRVRLVGNTVVDDWYDESRTVSVDTPNQPCVFKMAGDMSPGNLASSTEAAESGESRTLHRVTLVVPLSDNIEDGDSAKHVVYVVTGEVVAEGPYRVERANVVGGDMPTIKVVVLHA